MSAVQATPLLIGILADVSGSMQKAINNSKASSTNRLEAFSDALERVVADAAASIREHASGPNEPDVRLFAYGFGFGNVLAGFLGRRGPKVRDLLAPLGQGERTVSLVELARDWQQYQANVRKMTFEMFGETPMLEALKIAQERIVREIAHKPSDVILFLLSDGAPTDTNGKPTEIYSIAQAVKDAGATIVSCFVTDEDFGEARHLYGIPQASWDDAAQLMFRCASEVPVGSSFEAQLRDYSWHLESGARLFAQVNHSDTMQEFMNLVSSPIRERPPDKAPKAQVREAGGPTQRPRD
jgi:hypothetical protein